MIFSVWIVYTYALTIVDEWMLETDLNSGGLILADYIGKFTSGRRRNERS